MGAGLTRWVLTPLLIVLGIQLWLLVGAGDFGLSFQRKLLIAAAAASLLPPVNKRFLAFLDRIRHPTPRQLIIAALAISLVSACYFPFTAWYQHRTFAPKWQDEMSYLIQVRMLAQGRLWMPRHPVGDFFDSFQLIVDPVYASMYFPGASLIYVPTIWLGVPYWTAAAIAAGLCVGLTYLIVTDLIDGVAGALAALMILGLTTFRKMSLMVVGQPAIVLWGLLMLYAWLRWRKTFSTRAALVIGVFAGWAAITRPLDAVILAAPIGVDLLLCFRSAGARRWLMSFGCILVGAAPFLLVQIAFNIGVTGKWYQTPFQYYADRDYPGTELGFHPLDPSRRPISQLPQKQKFHDEWTVPAIQRHQLANLPSYWMDKVLPIALGETLPHRLMFILLPLSVLRLTTRPRLLIWLIFPLFFALYSLYAWFFPHYAMIVAPTVILMVLLGARQVEAAWPRIRPVTATFLTLSIIILSATEMAEFNRYVQDEFFDPQGLRQIDAQLASLQHKPAVVFFRFDPRNSPHEEPVYNTDVAWPDDAPVVRAHDLGARNKEIFRYYARHQPQRAFYLYDRGDKSMRFLGWATDLAKVPE